MRRLRILAVLNVLAVLASWPTVTIASQAAGTVTLSGRVTAADTGLPLAGVEIDVISIQDGFAGPGPREAGFTQTAADGTWTVTGLAVPAAPGFWVCFQTAFIGSPNLNYSPNCWKNSSYYGGGGASGYVFLPSDATAIPVTAGQSVPGIDGALPRVPHEKYSGRVTAADTGAPLPGVYVQVLGSASAGRQYDVDFGATTAADGSYEVSTSIQPGTTSYLCFSTIATAQYRYANQCWNDAAWTALNTLTYPPAPGATPLPTGIDLDVSGMNVQLPRLPATGAVSGTLRGEDGRRLAGATVTVFHYTNGTPALVATTKTAVDGTYRAVVPNNQIDEVCFSGTGITGGPSDRYGYLPSCVGIPVWNPTTPPSGFGIDVEVVGETTAIDGVMRSAGEIAGRVTQVGFNVGLRNVGVIVFDNAGGTIVAAVPTTSNGSYRIDNLAPGNYRVCFDGRSGKGGYTLHWYASQCWSKRVWNPLTSPPASAVAVTVVGGASTSNINAALAAA